MRLILGFFFAASLFVLFADSSDRCSGITYTTGAATHSGPCYVNTGAEGACKSTTSYTARAYDGRGTYKTSASLPLYGYGQAGQIPVGCAANLSTCLSYKQCANYFVPATMTDPAYPSNWLFSPRSGMRIAQQPMQLSGFYLAGLLCLAAAILKLTIEGHWSWWRVLLPLWGGWATASYM